MRAHIGRNSDGSGVPGREIPRIARVQASEDGPVAFNVWYLAFFVGQVLELGSGLQISKLAWGVVLGFRVLTGPILKLERPTPAAEDTASEKTPMQWHSRLSGGRALLLDLV